MENEPKHLGKIIKTNIFVKDNDPVLITAGVGAGKNYWVKNDLIEFGKVFFITSRAITKMQMIKDSNFTDNYEEAISSNKNLAITHQSLYKIFKECKNITSILEDGGFKFLVVDEVHSVFSDTFSNSAFNLFSLIDYYCDYGKSKIKVILMSATTELIEDFGNFDFDSLVEVRNYLNYCYNLLPKKIIIVDKQEAFDIMKTANNLNKMVYMINASEDINNKMIHTLTNKYEIDSNSISTLMADSSFDKFISKEFKDKSKIESGSKNARKTLYDKEECIKSLVKYEKLPENTNILITTSKLKEGINLKDSSIKAMFCESHDKIDIIQFSGRYRGYLDTFYIVNDAKQLIKSPTKIKTMKIAYICEKILLPKINEFIKNFPNSIKQTDLDKFLIEYSQYYYYKDNLYKKSKLNNFYKYDIKDFIYYLNDNRDYIKYNFFSKEFELFNFKEISELSRYKNCKEYNKNKIKYLNSFMNVDIIDNSIINPECNNFSNNDKDSKHSKLESEFNIISKYLNKNSLLDKKLSKNERNKIMKDLIELTKCHKTDYSALGNFFKRYSKLNNFFKLTDKGCGAHDVNDYKKILLINNF